MRRAKSEEEERTEHAADKVKEQIPYGGLGSTVDPKLLDQVKNLCMKCGEYRGCTGDCG